MPRESAIDSEIAGERHARDTDRVIGQLAERQHGRVARRQLLALGIRGGAIDRRLERQRLRPTRHPGVYAVGHRVRSRNARWMEAVLAAGPGAYLGHRAAAALWGILESGRIEIIVPGARRSHSGITFHRHRLRPDEVTIVDGIPVTTVPRTIFDAWMTVAGRRFEVDCVWRGHKLMVALDGWAAHGTRRAYERDRERDRFLVRHGWRVVRITWVQLRDGPRGVAEDIAALLYPG